MHVPVCACVCTPARVCGCSAVPHRHDVSSRAPVGSPAVTHPTGGPVVTVDRQSPGLRQSFPPCTASPGASIRRGHLHSQRSRRLPCCPSLQRSVTGRRTSATRRSWACAPRATGTAGTARAAASGSPAASHCSRPTATAAPTRPAWSLGRCQWTSPPGRQPSPGRGRPAAPASAPVAETQQVAVETGPGPRGTRRTQGTGGAVSERSASRAGSPRGGRTAGPGLGQEGPAGVAGGSGGGGPPSSVPLTAEASARRTPPATPSFRWAARPGSSPPPALASVTGPTAR